MTSTQENPEPQIPGPDALPGGALVGLDAVHGHLCDNCRLAWIGGFTEEELGLDPEISSTFSDSARGFAESAKHMACSEEPDPEHNGYFDCLICDETSIGGYQVIAFLVP